MEFFYNKKIIILKEKLSFVGKEIKNEILKENSLCH